MITAEVTTHGLALAGIWLAAGTVMGGVFFLSLHWNVRMLTAGRATLPIIAVQLARLAAISAALTAIALYFGALPLLAASAGVLLARTAVLRWGA
jgi:F1F0 ATPase subunit 2